MIVQATPKTAISNTQRVFCVPARLLFSSDVIAVKHRLPLNGNSFHIKSNQFAQVMSFLFHVTGSILHSIPHFLSFSHRDRVRKQAAQRAGHGPSLTDLNFSAACFFHNNLLLFEIWFSPHARSRRDFPMIVCASTDSSSVPRAR